MAGGEESSSRQHLQSPGKHSERRRYLQDPLGRYAVGYFAGVLQDAVLLQVSCKIQRDKKSEPAHIGTHNKDTSPLVQAPRLFVVAVFFFLNISCKAQTVLDLPQKTVISKLLNGEPDFIFQAESSRMAEFARIDRSAPFYVALLLENTESGGGKFSAGEKEARVFALLTEALQSPLTKKEASKKLLALKPDYFFEQYNTGSSFPGIAEDTIWEEAFKIAARAELKSGGLPAQEKNSGILENYFLKNDINPAGIWLFERLSLIQGITDPALFNAIKGRVAVCRRSYKEALSCFKEALKAGQTDGAQDEKRLPEFFLSRAPLFSDLGSAFQYSSPAEGIRLFNNWRDLLSQEPDFKPDYEYELLFFSGRAARGQKKYAEAKEFFKKAFLFAPDGKQKDASIWYILDCTFNDKPEKFNEELKRYAPLWTEKENFYDILDKFSARSVKKRDWEAILDAFPSVFQYGDRESRAKYAYITGKAKELGFLQAGPDKNTADYYYNIAFSAVEDRKDILKAAYYRVIAAKALNKPAGFDFISAHVRQNKAPDNAQNKELFYFLENFFKYGCGQYLYPYIKKEIENLSPEELRFFAKKFQESGNWQDSILLSNNFINRKDYALRKNDLEFSYPRGYREYVENYAREAGIDKALFFSLIRQESLFNAKAHSSKNAGGLTQLMEETALETAEKLARAGGSNYIEDGKVDLFNPEINIHLGALYLKELLVRLENEESAILAYNGGITRIRRLRRGAGELPEELFLEGLELSETREYGRFVLGGRAIYNFLY